MFAKQVGKTEQEQTEETETNSPLSLFPPVEEIVFPDISLTSMVKATHNLAVSQTDQS